MHPEEIKALIESGLQGATADVRSPDGTHFEAMIVAPQFEGASRVRRHQMVYATLGEKMGNEIHALSFRALSPDEASQD